MSLARENPQFGHIPHPDYSHIDWFSNHEQIRFEALLQIPRFHAIPEMSQRTSVAAHTLRVTMHTNFFSEALLETGVELDQPLMMFVSDHHDDPEIITGDTPTPVKRSATPEQLDQMEMTEDLAAKVLDRIISKPKWMSDFPGTMGEYRKKDSFEARIINFLDKWDGLNEAIHEVVTGENKIGFVKVIGDYKPVFDELYPLNQDWIPAMEEFVEAPVFAFPEVKDLIPIKPEDASYDSADSFIESISRGRPECYRMWLKLNRYLFKGFMLEHTFPGWKGRMPIDTDLEIVNLAMGERRTRSGLYIPSGVSYRPFMETFFDDDMYSWIQKRGSEIRAKNGKEKAKGIFYMR